MELMDNLVVSYIFEKSKAILNPKIYHGIYQVDGLVIFKVNEIAKEIQYWLEDLQKIVNRAAGDHHLHFAEKIWKTDANVSLPTEESKVQVVTNNELLFLDMKTIWSLEGDLRFGVFRKRDSN